MFRALFVKELREIWWLGLVPMAVVVYTAAAEAEFGRVDGFGFGFRHYTNPEAYHTMPFHGPQFSITVLLWGGILAGILGLWQTFRESQSRTWHFVLHRPVDRSLILWSKVAASAVIFALAILLPVIAVCLWAATPGTHASPFRWSLTGPVWFAAATGSAIYLAALFAGLRRGHLIGPRWWPLIGVAAWFGCAGAAFMGPWPTGFFLLMWGSLLVCDTLLASTVRDELRSADFN